MQIDFKIFILIIVAIGFLSGGLAYILKPAEVITNTITAPCADEPIYSDQNSSCFTTTPLDNDSEQCKIQKQICEILVSQECKTI